MKNSHCSIFFHQKDLSTTNTCEKWSSFKDILCGTHMLDSNIFYITSHKKGLGRARMLCHSPLPKPICFWLSQLLWGSYKPQYIFCAFSSIPDIPSCKTKLLFLQYILLQTIGKLSKVIYLPTALHQSSTPYILPYYSRRVGACGHVHQLLDTKWEGLEINSQYWLRIEVLGKLFSPHSQSTQS